MKHILNFKVYLANCMVSAMQNKEKVKNMESSLSVTHISLGSIFNKQAFPYFVLLHAYSFLRKCQCFYCDLTWDLCTLSVCLIFLFKQYLIKSFLCVLLLNYTDG